LPTLEVRILLDENLDWRLERFLPGHEVKSVPRLGWAGLKNGKLLTRAQENFDVLITMDSSMVAEQNLARFRIAIVALRAPSNRLADTSPLIPKVLALLPTLKPGKVARVMA
jgi:predicted nuclease of predicted toxin-antitoxin system